MVSLVALIVPFVLIGVAVMVANPFGSYSALLFGASFLLGPAIVVIIVVSMKKRASYFQQHGLDGHAKVLGISQTGTYVNRQPQLAFQLEVYVGDRPAYCVNTTKVVPMLQLHQMKPGITIQVKVDPKKPNNVMF